MKKLLLIAFVLLLVGCNFGRGFRGVPEHERWLLNGRSVVKDLYRSDRSECEKLYYWSGIAPADNLSPYDQAVESYLLFKQLPASEQDNRYVLTEQCMFRKGYRHLPEYMLISKGMCGDPKYQFLPACQASDVIIPGVKEAP